MKFSWILFISIGVVLVLAVLAMFIWRRRAASHEMDTIHVLADEVMIPQQVAMAHKLEMIDKWGKLLTVVTVVYLITMGAIYLYQAWVASSTTGM
jgi:ABC-type iron transport system FetAB permease component